MYLNDSTPWHSYSHSPHQSQNISKSDNVLGGISLFYLLQCDPDEPGSCDSGCNGGLMNSAFEYTLKAGGLMREEDYPYTGNDRGTCKFDKSKIAASVANFSVVTLNEDQIAANLVKNGPLASNYLELSIL